MIDYKKIKLVVFDVDGVLTSGHYDITNTGIVSKRFYTRDFYAIEQLLRNNIIVLILTQSHTEVIKRQIERIRKSSDYWDKCWMAGNLNVEISCGNKYYKLKEFLMYRTIKKEEIVYMGDAEGDLECMQLVGITACPSDAIDIIKEESNYISEYKGGEGCVYDFVMHILKEIKK